MLVYASMYDHTNVINIFKKKLINNKDKLFYYPCCLSWVLPSYSLSFCLSLCLLSHVDILSSQNAAVSDGTQRICLSVTTHVLLVKNNKLSNGTHAGCMATLLC